MRGADDESGGRVASAAGAGEAVMPMYRARTGCLFSPHEQKEMKITANPDSSSSLSLGPCVVRSATPGEMQSPALPNGRQSRPCRVPQTRKMGIVRHRSSLSEDISAYLHDDQSTLRDTLSPHSQGAQHHHWQHRLVHRRENEARYTFRLLGPMSNRCWSSHVPGRHNPVRTRNSAYLNRASGHCSAQSPALIICSSIAQFSREAIYAPCSPIVAQLGALSRHAVKLRTRPKTMSTLL